jgi:hypothetical protein
VEPIKDYNIKMGQWTAKFDSSLVAQYNDNIGLGAPGVATTGPTDDFIITPSVGMQIAHPISRYNGFRFDISLGYASHVNFPQLDGLRVGPRSSMDFHFKVGDVTLTLYDELSSSSDASTRTEVSGNGNPSSVNFQRLVNTIGLSANWNPTRTFSLTGGISYGLDRGLSDAFSQLNRDSRQFNLAAYQRVHTTLTLGLTSFYNDYTYPQRIQNDGAIYGVGPLIAWHPSHFINLSAAIHYTVTQFAKTGSIMDADEYAGLTYDFSVSHQIRQRIFHSLTFSKNINTGYGSNFTDLLSVGYQIGWSMNSKTGVSLNTSFQQSKQSAAKFGLPQNQLPFILLGGEEIIQYPAGSSIDPSTGLVLIPVTGEAADIYQVGLGFTRQLGRRMNLGLGVSRIIRETAVSAQGYTQNTVTLTFGYRF